MSVAVDATTRVEASLKDAFRSIDLVNQSSLAHLEVLKKAAVLDIARIDSALRLAEQSTLNVANDLTSVNKSLAGAIDRLSADSVVSKAEVSSLSKDMKAFSLALTSANHSFESRLNTSFAEQDAKLAARMQKVDSVLADNKADLAASTKALESSAKSSSDKLEVAMGQIFIINTKVVENSGKFDLLSNKHDNLLEKAKVKKKKKSSFF